MSGRREVLVAKKQSLWAELQRDQVRRQRQRQQAMRMEAKSCGPSRERILEGGCAAGREYAKERKRLNLDARKAEAASMTSKLQSRIAELDSVLSTGLRERPLVTFASLKPAPSYPPFEADGLDRPLPPPRWEQFAPARPSGLGKLLAGASRYEREGAAARKAFETEQHRHAMADAERRRKLAELQGAYDRAAAAALGAIQDFNASVDRFQHDFRPESRKPSPSSALSFWILPTIRRGLPIGHACLPA